MALVDETRGAGEVRRLPADSEYLPRLGQPQLDQVGVGWQIASGLGCTVQAKATGITGADQLVQADILVKVCAQVVAGFLRHQRQA